MKKFLLLLLIISYWGCEKGMDDYRNAKPASEVPVSTYDFLKQQGDLYDTLVLLIDRTKLTDTLKNQTVTFFVPQDISIATALYNLNFTRSKLGYKGNWTLDSVPLKVWDSLLRRYIVRGVVNADSLRYADGTDLISLYGHAMNGKTSGTNASGAVNGGTQLVLYSDKNDSRFSKDWSVATTQNVDVKTKNGMMHILESKHVFGFTSFVGKAFPESLEPLQGPFLGYPIPIPGIVEAPDYDEGGEGIAYHDNDKGNTGGQYRNEDVDMENCSEGNTDGGSPGGRYNVGWTRGSEWLRYTVDIAEAGDYKVEIRVAGPGGGIVHLLIDEVDMSGPITFPDTGGWQNWQGVFANVKLPAGKHYLKFFIEKSNFNLHRYIFKKI
ncbi:MAG TPA: carbohydrate-binding protein [Chitinophaga sp.]|uniref:carbohydrate-binding protein n=1 Tax=Chitinophaga sp. TaxID=1869181 RepID=UPI002BFA9258|nr:carbohydrate-binding protein [Chitinophaga sp.]HVI48122.1 carbohydrate-binding protein [Chitinophaga sp.]